MSLKEGDIGNFTKDRKIHGECNCVQDGVWFKDRKRCIDLMLSLKETLDLLAMANSVCWHGSVFRREDGHAFRRAVAFEVEG